jgi:iron complex outermembrane receptor protein
MKKSIYVFILVSWCVASSAQESFNIQIIDSITNNPIEGVSVSAKNDFTGLTDKNGKFSFTYKSKYILLTISSIGYINIDIIVLPNHLQTIRLKREIQLMDPIEIKSVRAGDIYPFTQTLITKKEIEKRNTGQDLPFILNQIPGTVANSDAGNGIGYTGIRIRGTDPSRINITLNGIPYNDAESQGVFFVNIPDIISSANNIQVQRGVGTSSNGTGAFGATINLMTNEVAPNAYGNLSNSIGSFQSIKNTIKAGTGLIDKRYTIDMRMSTIKSNGYIERAKTDLKSFYLSAASIKEKSSLRLNIFSGKEKTYQAWYGVSEGQLQSNRRYNQAGTEKKDTPYDNETDNYTQTHYQLFYNKKIKSNWSLNNSTYVTNGGGYYEQYKTDQEYLKYGLKNRIINNNIITKTDLVRQLWLKNTLVGNNITIQHKTNNKEIILGLGSNAYNGNHFGKVIWADINIPKDFRWYNLDAKKSEQFIFGKWLQRLENDLVLFGDLQIRRIEYNINGFRDNPNLQINNHWTFVNPKVGIRKKIGKYNFFASYAMANKEPNRDDFESGVKENPKFETLHDFETGIERKKENQTISATAYYMRYKNQLILTGKINDVGAYTRSNIPNSYRLGIEIEHSTVLTKWLKINGNIAISENKILDFTDYYDDYDEGDQKTTFYSKANISFSPTIVGSSTISLYIIKQIQINLISKYVGRQYLDNTSRKDRSLNPYFVQDLQIDHRFNLKNIKSTELVIQINNIWNKLYEPNGYTYTYKYEGMLYKNNYYYPMATTNFMIGLNIGL